VVASGYILLTTVGKAICRCQLKYGSGFGAGKIDMSPVQEFHSDVCIGDGVEDYIVGGSGQICFGWEA